MKRHNNVLIDPAQRLYGCTACDLVKCCRVKGIWLKLLWPGMAIGMEMPSKIG